MFDLKKSLENYYPLNQYEKDVKIDMLQLLASNKDCFQRFSEAGHFTGSCWLVNNDNSKFLLTLHKKLGFWLQLGGHADGDSNLLRVAIKEAYEESGLSNIVVLSPEIFDIDLHYIPKFGSVPGHYHYDVRFLLKNCDSDDKIKISDESNDLRWFDELPDKESSRIERMFLKWESIKSNLK